MLPTNTLIDPDDPPVAAPTAITTLPVLPLALVPLLNNRLPDAPDDVTLPVVNVKPPEPVLAPPLKIDTVPDDPDNAAHPDAMYSDPDVPVVAVTVPELKIIDPLLPAAFAFADRMFTDPLDVLPAPLVIWTPPPVAADVVPPADSVT